MIIQPKAEAAAAHEGPAIDRDAAARAKAATQFEAILVRQLLAVMRNTAKSGGMATSSGASGQYLSMFDEAIADSIAESGGIGLSAMFAAGMGGGDGSEAAQALSSMGTTHSSLGASSGAVSMPTRPAIEPPSPALKGATARLAHSAYAMASRNGGQQWARAGTLTPQDLTSQIATPTADGAARFSVRDAAGFKDAYKCNLFALEAARRAGFQVPVVARAQGWGFPTSNTVTEDAADHALKDNWAEVVAPDEVSRITAMLERGEVGVLLTGGSDDGRHGHMAVVERIHSVKLGKDGQVDRIEFDGYEARVNGAEHLERRTWNRFGHGQDQGSARNGFGAIEILALRPARNAQSPEITSTYKPNASNLDASSSSPLRRPIP